MKPYILFFLFLFLSFISNAQGIDQNPDQGKIVENIIIGNFEEARTIINSKFLKGDNSHKKIIGYVFAARIYQTEGNSEKVMECLEKAKELAAKSNNLADSAYVSYGYANLYMRMQKWDLGLKYANQALGNFKKLPYENTMIALLYIEKFSNLTKNPLSKKKVEDLKEGVDYAERSNNPIVISCIFSDLCVYYSQEYEKTKDTKLRDSIFIFNKNILPAIQKVKDINTKRYLLAMYYINYGGYLIHLNNNTESLASFNKGISYIKDSDSWKVKWLPFAYNGIGCNYEMLGDWTKAEEYYLKAIAATSSKINYARLNIVNTRNLANSYAAKRNFEKAYQFQVQATELVTQHAENQKEQAIETIEVLHKTQEKSAKIEQLEKDKATVEQQRWMYISIIVLAGMGIASLLYLLKFRNRVQRQEKVLLESQKKEIELSFQLQQEENSRLEAEQALLTLQIQQIRKDAIAKSLRLANNEKYLNDLNDKIVGQDPSLSKIIKEQQKVDQELANIQNQINNIHPNFFNSLKAVAKIKLSKIDLKYATYIYMELDNQQIAKILNVDLNTVRVTKFRFKQKLGLSKEESLLAFILNLAKNL